MLLSILLLATKLFTETVDTAVGRSDALLDGMLPTRTYIDALANARDKVVSAASKLDVGVEGGFSMAGKADATAGKAELAAEHERIGEMFHTIASGAADLRQIERLVDGSDLASSIKQQVSWNLQKMSADVDKLQQEQLDPVAREALLKALELRFSVLLSPAFWEASVNRTLLSQ